jgi:dCMP deaminase
MSKLFDDDIQLLKYMKQAYKLASVESTDPSTQNAALLIAGNTFLCGDTNHFPLGVIESAERWERPTKYQYVEHAERNVIFKAARMGIKTKGLLMVCPWFACQDCGRAIIQAGITEVVGHDLELHKNSVSWQQSIAVAYQMLSEAGVKMRHIKGKVGEVIRFNGSEIDV